MRQIDAHRAVQEIKDFQQSVTCDFSKDYENGMNAGFDYAVDVIEQMPTAEAIPIDYLMQMARVLKDTSHGRSVDIIDLIVIAWRERQDYYQGK